MPGCQRHRYCLVVDSELTAVLRPCVAQVNASLLGATTKCVMRRELTGSPATTSRAFSVALAETPHRLLALSTPAPRDAKSDQARTLRISMLAGSGTPLWSPPPVWPGVPLLLASIPPFS